MIDAMGLVFRAYHALSRSGLQSIAGEPTSAVFGFANILTSLLEREKPEYIAAVFDTKEPTFRHERYADYKANRQAFPEDLAPQLVRIKELVDALGIRRIEMAGYEADDIVGTLARHASESGSEVYCISSDKDYFQMVNDRVKILRPGKDSGEYNLYDAAAVKVRLGVAPAQVIDVLALTGDASDNVPGVNGIGEKTAVPLVEQFGSLEGIYDNLQNIGKESVRQKLESHRNDAFLSKELVTIHTEVPTDITPSDCHWQTPRFDELDQFFSAMNFSTLRAKWQKKKAVFAEREVKIPSVSTEDSDSLKGYIKPTVQYEYASSFQTIADIPHNYILVASDAAFSSMLQELHKAEAVSVDLETTSLDAMNCGIVGVALCALEGRSFFIATEPYSVEDIDYEQDADQHSLFAEPKEDYSSGRLQWHSILGEMKKLLENPEISKIGQNIKFDALILKRHGINLSPIVFDTMLADYVLDPDKQHSMDALAERWMNYKPIPITTLIGDKKQGSMLDAPLDKVAEYAAEDADVTLKLYHILDKKIADESLEKIARTIEFPLVEVLVEMEHNGVALDTSVLGTISEKIQNEVRRLRAEIFREADVEFNIDSPKQVGEILFGKLMLPATKKNKSGYSTDVSVLSDLSADFPIAGMILEHRQLQKLQSTYVDALPRMINLQTGRIHTTFNQTAAGTGRLSSSDPNLQNIPIRTDIGRSIRQAFVSQRKDAVLLSADYSQIELRIMAHVADDPVLTDAFRHGKDIHAATAAALFNTDISAVSQQQRRIAKTVNFGIMYGQGAFGLSQQLGISRSEAKSIIDQYFAQYAGIRRYMDDTLETAREKGFARTLLGRRKYFPMLTSRNQTLRQASERAAVNMPIQGTAADMMKLAMIHVHAAMKKYKMRSMMILQIHDELVFEAREEELDDLRTIVKEQMENAYTLGNVPVVVEIGIGNNWEEAH